MIITQYLSSLPVLGFDDVQLVYIPLIPGIVPVLGYGHSRCSYLPTQLRYVRRKYL